MNGGFLYIDVNNEDFILDEFDRIVISIDNERRDELLNNKKPIVLQNFSINGITHNSYVFNSIREYEQESVHIGRANSLRGDYMYVIIIYKNSLIIAEY